MNNVITNKRIFSVIIAVIMLFCVLPFNSVSFETDGICILHNGKTVSEIKLPNNEKTVISVSENDADFYRWQILMPDSSQWIDIYDKTSVSCEISYTLLERFIDSSNKSQLRCEIEKNGKTNQSSTLTVEIKDAAVKEEKPLKLNKPMLLADNSNNAPGEEEFITHTVTIKYLYYNESPEMVGSVANDYIATIAVNTDFDAEVSSPVRTGYKAYLAEKEDWDTTDNRWFSAEDEATLTNGENVKVNIKNISKDYIFYVVYLPQPAKYHISTYFQNKYDDFYSFGKSITKEATVGTVISNSTEPNLNTEGFTMLEYDDVTVAADGSTVIEIFFDRKYHLINFELDGGYGVEPIYARYGTDFKISKPSKAGYKFEGWEIVNDNNQLNNEQVKRAGEMAENLVNGTAVSIPDFDITFKAKWTKANATYNVVYWKENANDNGYSYWGTVTQTAQSGDTITFDPENVAFNTAKLEFSSDVVQEAVNATSENNGENFSAIPARYEYEYFTFNENLSDSSKVVMGDSSTVLNVYYKRNTYDLKYYYARSSVNDKNQYCKNIMPNSDGILPNGDYVVWFKGATINDKVVTNNASGNRLQLSGNVNVPNAYTLKFKHISDSSYYVTDENGRYLFIGDGSAEFRETATNITITYNSDGDFWLLKCDGQYLNQYGGSGANVAAGYWKDDDGCQLLISQPLDYPVISKYQVCSSTRQPIMQNMTWSYNTFTFPEFSDDRYTYGYDVIDGYVYHYLTLNNVKYNQIITHLWPVNVLPQVMHYLTPEWAPFDGCKYRTDNKANATLKVYSTLSAEIINNPGDSESSKFVAWWGDKNHPNENFQIQNFHINYSAIPNEEAGENYNGINYVQQPGITYVMSYNKSTQVTPIELYGVELQYSIIAAERPSNANEQTMNSTFYYTRNPHILEFYNVGDKIHTDNLVYGQKIESFNTITAEIMERDYYPSQYEQGAYTFKGWSLSPSAYVPVDWENFRMDDADLSVYAYWEKTTHKVTFYETYNDLMQNKPISDSANGNNEVDVLHGEPVSYASTISRDGYDFVGWFYLNEETNEKIAFLPNNMPVNKDLKIYAEWVADKMIRYTIHYVGVNAKKDDNNEYLFNDGKYVLDMESRKQIADDTVGQLQDGRTKTFSAKALPELWDEYNTRYFPELASHAIMFSEDTNETDPDVIVTKVNMDGTPYDGEGEYTYTIEYTFYYVYLDKVQYTVNYINTATGNNMFESAENDTNTFEVASKSQLTDEAVTTERFKMIQKYVPDEYQKRIVLTAYPDHNIINFYYTENISPMFLVEHLTENLDGTWTVQVREFSTGNIGETISRHPFNYEGHVFKPDAAWVNTQGQEIVETDGDKWVNTYTLQEDETYKAEGILESGRIIVIRFYYVLTLHDYTIEHKIIGSNDWLFGTKENSSETGTNKKYGERFEGWARQEDALKIGYYVDGSKTDPSRLYQSKIITDGDNVITFYYVSEPIEINYRVIVNGVVATNINGCYVTPTLNSTSSHASSVNGSTPFIAAGYYFDGWYADEQCSKKVSPDWIGADNKITPKPENGIISQETYYAKVEPCSLTITKKGDVKANETFLFNVASTDGKFDKVVSITGNNSTTIDYIPQGEYTITEISDWSWKYNNVEKQDVLISKNHIVEFENSRNENKLLGDESNNNNVFAAVS